MRFAVPGLLGLGLFLAALPPRAAAADPFAASVLSCTAEIDRDKRLDCYDRAVANFTATLPRGADSRAGVAVLPSPAAAAQPAAVAGSQPTAASAATNREGSSAGAPPRHVTARVVSVDY